MSSILFVVTHGRDNATKAIIPLEMAAVAAKSGHEVNIALLGEGVFLLKDDVIKELLGVGTAPLKDAMKDVIDADIPMYACGTCMQSRGLSESVFEGNTGRHMNKDIFIELTVTSDKVLTF